MSVLFLQKSDESYLQRCAQNLKEKNLVFGIIIGQKLFDDYLVAHLARNNEEDVDFSVIEAQPLNDSFAEHTSQVLSGSNLANLSTQLLAHQWLSAVRMVPGSFTVLGFFVGAKNDEIIGEKSFKIVKEICKEIHALLQSKHFGIEDLQEESILLFFALETNEMVCMSYSHSDSTNSLKSIDCQLSRDPLEWHMFSCYYELNDFFPIREIKNQTNIETQFSEIITAIAQCLQSSDILIQNEKVNDETTVETYIKEMILHNKKCVKQEPLDTMASIFLKLEWKGRGMANKIQVKLFRGTMRLVGGISSRVFCNPRNTFRDVKRFIRCDIIRSLIARIQVYCEGLTEKKISPDTMFNSHPPRRVYFNLSTTERTSSIQFSEYVFKNETKAFVLAQVHQILDLDLNRDNILDDLEASTFNGFNFTEIHPIRLQQQLSNESNEVPDLPRSMFALGIVVSLFVLLSSVCLNCFFKL